MEINTKNGNRISVPTAFVVVFLGLLFMLVGTIFYSTVNASIDRDDRIESSSMNRDATLKDRVDKYEDKIDVLQANVSRIMGEMGLEEVTKIK